nr:YidC/Oxa1 family membrane protein insertase [Clostridioides difficile]
MNIIGNFLGLILKVIFEFVNHYGISIILFTILVKIILLPLTIKQTKSTKAMQDIQPRIKEIQEKYKNKPEKQNEEIVKLYGEAKINPLSGCLPLLIQFPILIGLFSVLREPVAHGVFANKAAFLAADNGFLWIKSLTSPDYVLAVFSGASAYVMAKSNDTQRSVTRLYESNDICNGRYVFLLGIYIPSRTYIVLDSK